MRGEVSEASLSPRDLSVTQRMLLIGYELGQEVFAKNGSYEMGEISAAYDEPAVAPDSYLLHHS